MLIFVSVALLGALFLLFGLALLLFPGDIQRIMRELLGLVWGDRAQSFVIRGGTVVAIVMTAAGATLACVGFVTFFLTQEI